MERLVCKARVVIPIEVSVLYHTVNLWNLLPTSVLPPV